MPGRTIPPALRNHKADLEKFAEELIRPYVVRLNRARVPQFPKEFNDPIWGTLVLYQLEIVFLDSPLVQRLRRVRQLGVVHWVYPGATHTRLEHSIGVVHQVQSLITAINSHHPEKDRKFIDTSWTKLLRLAALLHDVGHGVMSHVSENAMADSRICEDIRLAFAAASASKRRASARLPRIT